MVSHKMGQLGLAAAVILVWLGACWYRVPSPQSLWFYDAPVYLSIAYDIDHFHRFTDGTGWSTPSVDPSRPSGMARTPLYPFFLAAAAELDPTFKQSLDCLVQHGAASTCPQRAPLPRALQFTMTVLVYLMLWLIAIRVTGSRKVGWLSLGVGLIAAPVLIRSVNVLMTETLTLFLTTMATLAAVEMLTGRHRLRWAVVSGIAVGLAALSRPPFAYFLPFAAVAVAMMIVFGSRQWRHAMTLVVFLVASACVITPWIVRNKVILNDPALTAGYAQLALTQRIAYDAMSWKQFSVFSLCSLPDGTGMGSLLVKPNACAKFGYDGTPNGFYSIGSTTLLKHIAIAAGGTANEARYEVVHYIIYDPVWHAIVSIPMAMRGLWIDHYWGFLLAIFCIRLTVRALRAFDAPMLAVTLPGWFMLAFYAALSANQMRYNLMLIIPFAIAGGMTINSLLTKFRWVRPAFPSCQSGAGVLGA
ncbi:hypothetical protein ACOSOMT5_P0881 [Acidiphilium sp. MT5]